MATGPSLTVEDIAKAVGVPIAKLDQECSEEHVKEISCFLESRQTLAPHLSLKETDIEEIDKDKRTEQEKRLKTLQKWKEIFIFLATYKVLMEALLKIRRADHARKVCCLLQSPEPDDKIQTELAMASLEEPPADYGTQYPPPQQPYYPAPPAVQQHQQTNVVVQQQQPQAQSIVFQRKKTVNHCLHFIIFLFCPWWIFVWLILCCIYGC